MASFILWIFITFYLWVTVRVIVSRVNHIFSIFYSSWLSGIANALKVSVLSPELPFVYASIITGLISLSAGGSKYIVLLMLCHLSKNIYCGFNPRNVQISVLLQSKYLANTLSSGYERNTFFFLKYIFREQNSKRSIAWKKLLHQFSGYDARVLCVARELHPVPYFWSETTSTSGPWGILLPL